MVFKESLFTGITVRSSGILCTLGWALKLLSGGLRSTTLGWVTLSGSMFLPIAGIGTPVGIVSPLSVINGCIVSPVTVFKA